MHPLTCIPFNNLESYDWFSQGGTNHGTPIYNMLFAYVCHAPSTMALFWLFSVVDDN
jgi:hypothetical protein